MALHEIRPPAQHQRLRRLSLIAACSAGMKELAPHVYSGTRAREQLAMFGVGDLGAYAPGL